MIFELLKRPESNDGGFAPGASHQNRQKTPEQLRKAAESQREYRRNNKEKVLAQEKKYRIQNAEKRKQYQRKYKLENSERLKLYQHVYYMEVEKPRIALNREYVNSRNRALYWKKRDHYLSYLRAWRAKKRSILDARENPEALLQIVYGSLPPTLPRFIRDEVSSEMILAVLEGHLSVQDVRGRAQEFLRRYNREFDCFKTLSLDAPIGGTELKRIDTIASTTYVDLI